ncbi:MAG TPA: M24 family metallopeptidase [Nitrososphaerales archaeon]|nr:M24 family metallopeptidase [Nitrososphaerales archaeon]
MVVESLPLKTEFLSAKMKLVTDEMQRQGIDVWITFTREGNQDPVSDDLRFGNLTWRSAALVSADGAREAVVGSLEVEAVKERGFYDSVYGYGNEGVAPKLRELVSKRRPKKIALNNSYDFGAADGLSMGMSSYIRKALKEHVTKFVSSEDLVVALKTVLVPGEVTLLRKSVELCEKVYAATEREAIRPGKTDAQIHRFMRDRAREMGLLPAWAEDHCPSVLIGSDPAGHKGYYGSTLKNGQFLKIDFGVKHEGYCSDIQRCYFVGSKSVPSEIKALFGAARAASDAALSKLKPGVRGYAVDYAARRKVVSGGYPEFMHATGHPLGRSTHELGPLLGPRWPWRYGDAPSMRVQKNMAFAIEPTVEGKKGTCNLEQDVLVTSSGYVELSKPQEELLVIG